MSADVKTTNEKKEAKKKTQQRIFTFKICKIEIKRKHIFFLSKSVFSHQKGRVWWPTTSHSQPGVIAQSHPHEAKESVVGVGAG